MSAFKSPPCPILVPANASTWIFSPFKNGKLFFVSNNTASNPLFWWNVCFTVQYGDNSLWVSLFILSFSTPTGNLLDKIFFTLSSDSYARFINIAISLAEIFQINLSLSSLSLRPSPSVSVSLGWISYPKYVLPSFL